MEEEKHGSSLRINKGVENSKIECMYERDNSGNNNSETILKEISAIEFPNLTAISLTWNNIETVEGFSRIMLPQSQVLVLGNWKGS